MKKGVEKSITIKFKRKVIYHIFVLLLMANLSSCDCKKDESAVTLPNFVGDSYESLAYYSPKEMINVYAALFNIYPSGIDSIILPSDYGHAALDKFYVDERKVQDKIHFSTKGLKVIVDDRIELSMLRNPIDDIVFFPPVNLDYDDRTSTELLEDSLEYEIETRYRKKYKQYYRAIPIYIINESDQSRYLTLKGNELYMILEAQDENKVWKPITMTTQGDCFPDQIIEIPARHFGVAKFLKFHGTFKTKLRVKLAVDLEIIYSDSFDGFIDPNQFQQPDDFRFYTILELPNR